MLNIPYKDTPDLAKLFAATSDRRIARMFYRHETVEIARLVGLTGTSRIREIDLVDRIRAQLAAGPINPPTCDCTIPEGRRWMGAERGEPITFHVSEQMELVHAGAGLFTAEALKWLEDNTRHLKFEYVREDQDPMILYDVQEGDSDGRGSTLGFAMSFATPTDDIYVGPGRWSVRISMDPAERWTDGSFRTVIRHESIHGVGGQHTPNLTRYRDNIMWASYRGERLHMGAWDRDHVHEKYLPPLSEIPT